MRLLHVVHRLSGILCLLALFGNPLTLLSAQSTPIAEPRPSEKADVTLRGIVIDTRTRLPLQNVLVRLPEAKRSAVTDIQGRFEFVNLPTGRHLLVVSAVNYILIRQEVQISEGQLLEINIPMIAGAGSYTEIVEASEMILTEFMSPSRQLLYGSELQNLSGGIVDDPIRAVHALPGVSTGDDLRCEFAVRGSGFRNIGISLDGVASPMLMHRFQQLEDSGSVAMINSEAIENISLLNGAYPQYYGNRTGAWLDFTLREGSRERQRTRLIASASSTSGIVEGPLGSRKNGSYLVSARYNYIDWLLRRVGTNETGSAFGFFDSQGKLVYDLNSKHQWQLSWLGGTAGMDNEKERPTADINDDWQSQNRNGMVTVALRSIFHPRFLLIQRISGVAGSLESTGFFNNDLARGTRREWTYRSDAYYNPFGKSFLEGGFQTQWLSENRTENIYGWTGPPQGPYTMFLWRHNRFAGNARRDSAYSTFRWKPTDRFMASPGFRVDHSTLTDNTIGSPWLQLEWKPVSSWILATGTGVYQQFPDFEQVLGLSGGGKALRPERAWHSDFSLTRRFGDTRKIRITAYNRQERDIARLRNGELQLFQGNLLQPYLVPTQYRTLLRGYSRGMEFLVQSGNPNGLSGWLAYTLGYTRYRDARRSEVFWGDFDQRHTFNAFAQYRFSSGTSVSGRYRYGSAMPIAGYYEKRGGDYFINSQRNQERYPLYQRLDLRANHTFNRDRLQITLFLEVLNVLNRKNYRPSISWVDQKLKVQGGLMESIIPFIPSVGILLEF